MNRPYYHWKTPHWNAIKALTDEELEQAWEDLRFKKVRVPYDSYLKREAMDRLRQERARRHTDRLLKGKV